MKPEKILPISESLKAIGSPIAYYPSIAKALGSVKATIFLCQFINPFDEIQNTDWISKTMDEIYESTGLTYDEQRRAKKILKNLNILEEKKQGIPAKNYYRINWGKLNELLNN